LAATAVVALAGCSASEATSSRTLQVGDTAVVEQLPAAERQVVPELRGRLLSGGQFDLADHRGKVVVVNVWGSWCAPCRAEAPHLQQVWTETQDRGVQFVGINVKDNDAAAKGFVRTYGITYPSLVDDDGRLLLMLRGSLPPEAIPSTIVIDRQGRIAARALGGITEQQLRRLVDWALAE
jgi:thiol-disulfide isomerase/thioredoxin